MKDARYITKLIGIISKSGNLYIKRGGDMKAQRCVNYYSKNCCDKCALFGEPYGNKVVKLSLCHKILQFEKLTDKRFVSCNDENEIVQK